MMMKRQRWCNVLGAAFFVLVLTGCDGFGKVDQGRVISFDKETKTCTLISDVGKDPKNPDYNSLPPVTYKLPTDPAEMGPEPKAGLLMNLAPEKHEITIFDPDTQDFKIIPYTVVEQKDIINKEDPLVFDKALKQPKSFPVIDRENKTITIYSKRKKVLITFAPPGQDFALPERTWIAGDEVRVYYKEKGKALRIMNISQTDIYKK